MENKENRRITRRRSGLFWPIMLIFIGVMLLLNNTGALKSDFWGSLLNLWPVFLILMGLDGLYKREGIVGAVFMIGLGVVFLLCNYGVLSLSIWGVIIRIWPLFLIAWGFDIFIGRRTLLGAIAGSILILAILAGTLFYMGARVSQGQILQTGQIRQDLQGATSAKIDIQPGAGSFRLDMLSEQGTLLMGSVPSGGQWNIKQDFSLNGNQAVYLLTSSGGPFVFNNMINNYNWDLGVTGLIPIELNIDFGAGDVDVVLSGLDLDKFSLDMGVGLVEVLLPDKGRFDAKIDSAIGQIVIIVPEGMGLRVEAGTALVVVEYPDNYQKENNTYTSPGYANADHRINLSVGLAIGQVTIRNK